MQSPAPAASTAGMPQAADLPKGTADRLRAELAQLQGEDVALSAETEDAPGSSSLEARRRAVSRLQSLLRQRLESIEASAQGRAMPPLPAWSVPQGADVQGSALQLDRLRDQLDSLVAQRAALRPLADSLGTRIEAALALQQRAAESLRLQQEYAERAGSGPDAGAARDALALARLEARIAELELAQADESRDRITRRLESLQAPIETLQRVVERARPLQKVEDADLAAIRESIQREREWIGATRVALEEELARSEAAARDARSAGEPAVKALRDVLSSLAELESVEAGREQIWMQRRSALSAASDDQRIAAASSLERSREQVRAHGRAVSERVRLLRSEIRLQASRITALPEGSDERQREARALDALQQQLEIQERLWRTLEDHGVILERTASDLAADGASPQRPSLPKRIWERVIKLAERVWQHELFNAIDSTVADGRVVSVAYGVTVGKALGVLVLAGLGWWLAARLSSRLLGLLVRRGRVSEQLARVLRGWLMAALLLAVMLVVLQLARVPLTAFAFLGGAIAIGVGFGTQNLIKNLISGVIVLFERKIRVGDIVTIDGTSGTVTAIDLRATTVRGFDGIHAILPNSRLLEAQVQDWSYSDQRIRATVSIVLALDADVGKAARAMLECAQRHPHVLAEPPPEALFDAACPAGLELKLLFWLDLGGGRAAPLVASDLRHEILGRLRTMQVPLAPAWPIQLAAAEAGPPAHAGGRNEA